MKAGDQVVGLEQAINRGFRYEVALDIGKAHGQFPWREVRLVEGQCDDPCADVIGDTVPYPIRPRAAIVQGLWPTGLILIAPSIERGSRDSDLRQRATNRQVGLFDEPDIGKNSFHVVGLDTRGAIVLRQKWSR